METLDPPVKPVTHKNAVRRIAGWLQNGGRSSYNDGCPTCKIVFAELATAAGETPDVIGWSSSVSVLVECKISRADFLADRKKTFRAFESSGVGNQRYFAAPAGMIKPEELPDGWGLLEIHERKICQTKKATPKDANKRAEVLMLCSAIRRLQIATAVFVVRDEDSHQSDQRFENWYANWQGVFANEIQARAVFDEAQPSPHP